VKRNLDSGRDYIAAASDSAITEMRSNNGLDNAEPRT
jgi:hypothetical protein